MARNYLEERSMEGLVLLSFMEKKKQKEAAEIIYAKDYQKINLEPFRRARDRLVEDGLLAGGESKRNKEFRTQTAALTEELLSDKDHGMSAEHRDELESVMEKMVESQWFRGFFSPQMIDKLYHLDRKDGSGRLSYDGEVSVITVIGQVIRDLSAFAQSRHPLNLDKPKEEFLESVNEHDSFDDFLEEQDWFMDEVRDYLIYWEEALYERELDVFDDISRHQIFQTLCSSHKIPESDSYELRLIFDLVYVSEALYKLPSFNHLVPGRIQSNLHHLGSDVDRLLRNCMPYGHLEEDMKAAIVDNQWFEDEERIKLAASGIIFHQLGENAEETELERVNTKIHEMKEISEHY